MEKSGPTGNITDTLAAFAADLSFSTLPEEVVERTKLLILDVSGITVRARYDAESTPSMLRAIKRLGLGDGACSVIGDSDSYAPPAAALLNGTLAHSLDFDDTHAEGSIHSSAPIVPAALAAAEIAGSSGKELITAIVAGYEIQLRLSMALDPAEHYGRGFHPTATCGIFGASAAAGKLLGLDKKGLVSAFGIALSQAAGSMQFLANGAWTKRSHVGQAAQNGLICAMLAFEGFKGPVKAFEGKAGFLKSYSPKPRFLRAISGLYSDWETMRLAVKPYPSCRYSHAAMDALIDLREEHSIDPAEIQDVVIGLPQVGINLIGDPIEVKKKPKSVVDGQFSMPFCAAVVLREGKMGWDHYSTHLADKTTLDLCSKVDCTLDPEAESAFPKNMSGKAKVRTSNKIYEKFVNIPKGEPENFLSVNEFCDKFHALAEPYLGAATGQLTTQILALEDVNDIRSVFDLARP